MRSRVRAMISLSPRVSTWTAALHFPHRRTTRRSGTRVGRVRDVGFLRFAVHAVEFLVWGQRRAASPRPPCVFLSSPSSRGREVAQDERALGIPARRTGDHYRSPRCRRQCPAPRPGGGSPISLGVLGAHYGSSSCTGTCSGARPRLLGCHRPILARGELTPVVEHVD